MIGRLTGKLLGKEPPLLWLDVNGVGYECEAPLSTFYKLPEVGQARGAALCAVAEAGLPLHEYAPASIKLAIAGSGRAEKTQVQRMVKVLLNLPAIPDEDAADALACALCHAHGRTLKLRTQKALQDAR